MPLKSNSRQAPILEDLLRNLAELSSGLAAEIPAIHS
jgi:hypothetical protein